MPKLPIQADGKTIEIQEFSDADERIVLIDDRFYRLWKIPDSDLFYFMVKVRENPRSIRGTHDKCIELLVRVHSIYRQYDNRVRKSKEDAQRLRDKLLNDLAETVS